jgi:hypothetical protein
MGFEDQRVFDAFLLRRPDDSGSVAQASVDHFQVSFLCLNFFVRLPGF